MEVGWRLWRLSPSWFLTGWREVTEVVTGTWYQSAGCEKKELTRTGWLVCSWYSCWVPLVLETLRGQKLVSLMSTNPLFIRYSCGVCVVQDFHFRLSSSDRTVPGVLSLKLLHACMPCCSMRYLFKQPGVFLFVWIQITEDC